MEARDGGDGFSGVRAASLGRPAEERCVVRSLLIFEVRAVRQSVDWRSVRWLAAAMSPAGVAPLSPCVVCPPPPALASFRRCPATHPGILLVLEFEGALLTMRLPLWNYACTVHVYPCAVCVSNQCQVVHGTSFLTV